jgi:hypothetical protein
VTELEFVLPVVLCITVLAVNILYWGDATRVSGVECGYWYSGGGRYLPWPWVCGQNLNEACFAVVVPMSSLDVYICSMVKTKLYVLLVICQIVATAFFGRMAVRRMVQRAIEEGKRDD